jgi:hypothetical protein
MADPDSRGVVVRMIVTPNESTVPLLHCVSAEETLAFWRALGFTVTYEQTKPYLYLAFRWSGFEIHYGSAPADLDPALENTGGCLVMVDSVAPYHAAFTEAMRRAHGKLLAKGRPRMTRYRPGGSRFSIIDPSLTPDEHERVRSAVADPSLLEGWLPDNSATRSQGIPRR